MTQPFDDEHGDRLRRALHAEAEAVTPSAEGLERIRSKINQRRERRLGFLSLSAPWLRPLAAVVAAVFVCVVTVSVTPALANFVQTGHFSPNSGGGDGRTTTEDGSSQGEVPPSGSGSPLPSASPSPTSIHPSITGKHVVNGSSCGVDEETVTPSPSPTAGDGAASGATTSQVTCQPIPHGGDTSSGTGTEGPPAPPVSLPPEVPPSNEPTSDAAPPVNPNQSP
jgi:hypothetical protein